MSINSWGKIIKKIYITTRRKVLWESTTPCKSLSPTLATPTKFLELQFKCRVSERANHFVSFKVWFSVSGLIVRRSIKCKQSPVHRVFWLLLSQPSTFPPRNLPIKFGTNPSTIFLIIVVTDKNKLTPVKTYSLAFARRIIADLD